MPLIKSQRHHFASIRSRNSHWFQQPVWIGNSAKVSSGHVPNETKRLQKLLLLYKSLLINTALRGSSLPSFKVIDPLQSMCHRLTVTDAG